MDFTGRLDDGDTAISYGGGWQSSAMIVLAVQGKIPAKVALFANVGDDSEYPETLAYVREVMVPWAAERGFPVEELQRRKRDGTVETLWGRLMDDSRSLPIPVRMPDTGAPGNRSCTRDFKILVVTKRLKELGASSASPVNVAIGISTDEVERIHNRRAEDHERPYYPLIDLGLDRSACGRILQDAGLPIPPKSACFFCPFHRPARFSEMRRDRPELWSKVVFLERELNDRRDAISCFSHGKPGIETRRTWRWSLPDAWWDWNTELDYEMAAQLWPTWLEGHPDAGWWELYGTCPDCDAREMRLDPDGSVPPHAKDHVYLTRFGKPIEEAIPEAQASLFALDSLNGGPESCDEGYCFT